MVSEIRLDFESSLLCLLLILWEIGRAARGRVSYSSRIFVGFTS